MRRRVLAIMACLLAAPAAAQPTAEQGPVLLEAAQVVYEPETERAIARGSVMLARGGLTLTADEVVYDQRAATVSATGDVVLVDDRGETYFADRMELRDDLRDGFIEGIAMRLSDDSLLVARRGDRDEGRMTDLRDVTYTPCPICPDSRPTWQINADAVNHDQVGRWLTYENATFAIAGVPVLYTPWFRHADPSTERQSGFLAPTLTSDSNLGFTLETPYYWAMAPNRDITFRPTFTTDENPVLAVDLRDLQRFGRTEATVSGTFSEVGESGNERFRGHIDAEGRYDLNADWDTGFDLQLASDRTYLRRYNIRQSNVLLNELFVSRVDNDRFIDISTLGFQTLRPGDDQGQVPLALPRVLTTFRGGFEGFGARWELTPDFLGLHRTDGIDSRRGSVGGTVLVPRISPWGDVFEASVSLRGDIYSVSGDAESGVDDGQTRWRTRLLPRATLSWRRPYAKLGDNGIAYEVEPVATFTVAPTGVNDDAIPNEDSLDLEFDETNLLLADRFTGIDRFDEGTKISWGLRTAALGVDRELWSVFLGQSYRVSETDVFEAVSGLDEQLSDVVGSVGVSPHPYVDVNYRFRMGAELDGLAKSDLQAIMGPPRLRVALGHLLLDETTDVRLARREEGRAALSLRLDDNWSLIAGARRDLDNGEDIRHSFGLIYEDACLTVVLGVDRDLTEDSDTGDTTTIALRLSLRNLGEFGGESGLAALGGS